MKRSLASPELPAHFIQGAELLEEKGPEPACAVEELSPASPLAREARDSFPSGISFFCLVHASISSRYGLAIWHKPADLVPLPSLQARDMVLAACWCQEQCISQ